MQEIREIEPLRTVALALALTLAAGYPLLEIKEAGYLLGSGAGRRRGEGAEKLLRALRRT